MNGLRDVQDDGVLRDGVLRLRDGEVARWGTLQAGRSDGSGGQRRRKWRRIVDGLILLVAAFGLMGVVAVPEFVGAAAGVVVASLVGMVANRVFDVSRLVPVTRTRTAWFVSDTRVGFSSGVGPEGDWIDLSAIRDVRAGFAEGAPAVEVVTDARTLTLLSADMDGLMAALRDTGV